jgi:hypothetical protein
LVDAHATPANAAGQYFYAWPFRSYGHIYAYSSIGCLYTNQYLNTSAPYKHPNKTNINSNANATTHEDT